MMGLGLQAATDSMRAHTSCHLRAAAGGVAMGSAALGACTLLVDFVERCCLDTTTIQGCRCSANHLNPRARSAVPFASPCLIGRQSARCEPCLACARCASRFARWMHATLVSSRLPASAHPASPRLRPLSWFWGVFKHIISVLRMLTSVRQGAVPRKSARARRHDQGLKGANELIDDTFDISVADHGREPLYCRLLAASRRRLARRHAGSPTHERCSGGSPGSVPSDLDWPSGCVVLRAVSLRAPAGWMAGRRWLHGPNYRQTPAVDVGCVGAGQVADRSKMPSCRQHKPRARTALQPLSFQCDLLWQRRRLLHSPG